MTPLYTNETDSEKTNFLNTRVPKGLLLLNAALAIVYFFLLTFWFDKGNTVLFALLIAGEVFHVWQALTFLYTIWDTEHVQKRDGAFKPLVDVFITVAGEPTDIVEATLVGAKNMHYPRFSIHLLNDGYVAKKDNWRDIEELAKKHGVNCITRKVSGGAKAGNINHGLSVTGSPFFAVFDADHVPHSDFLEKMMGYFVDNQVAFVQSPQFYKNHATNDVTEGSWEQQELWFGALCKGKNRLNAASMCGTNMVIRREAILEVGGMCTESIAEDFVTGMFLHAQGWKSVYVPEVLAEGLAPEDFLSYVKQQFRWARGAMDVIFRYNVFFYPGLTFAQRIQYLSSATYFLSGLVVLMNALIPVMFFFTGQVPFTISTMLLAIVFLPYMFLTLYVIQRCSNFTFTFKSLAFSMSAFAIHIKALIAAATRQKSSFNVTAKRQIAGNFLNLVIPHITYIIAVAIGMVVAIIREGFSPSVLTNIAWAMLNVSIFAEFIRAALPQREKKEVPAVSFNKA